ncbi:hypothetical protein FHS82_003874 [Pseudochelatococcus lubricantis]|uniref:Uncharacterized protein n=1 Tax=Pseudochelatococcus lubricantis TaxID=1538102 RepID=A0ABX0V477_9HYPH|nr:hypothetical protein [Pseudochelatococcus lubricantis]
MDAELANRGGAVQYLAGNFPIFWLLPALSTGHPPLEPAVDGDILFSYQ